MERDFDISCLMLIFVVSRQLAAVSAVWLSYTMENLVTTVKSETGIVEAMGLLMTQIRNSAGDLITIRNGEMTSVTNHSKDWSRMDFTVLVDYDTDTKQAMLLMQTVFKSVQADPTWASELIGEPDILGIEQFDVNGILLKIRTQTKPLQQFGVTREFRSRLNQAF
jgi:small conductance mechanosensitive channel